MGKLYWKKDGQQPVWAKRPAAIKYIASAGAMAMAILKQAVLMVFAKDRIYYCPAMKRNCNVKRIRWPRGDIFAESCKHATSNMKVKALCFPSARTKMGTRNASATHQPRSAIHQLRPLPPFLPRKKWLRLRHVFLVWGTLWIEFSDATTPPHSPGTQGKQGLALEDFTPAVGECPDVPDQAHPQSILPEESMSLGYSELSDADAAACCAGGASFKDACLIKCLQGLGLPVSCPSHVVHSQFDLATPCFNHFCFHLISAWDFQLYLMDSMERVTPPASTSLHFFFWR